MREQWGPFSAVPSGNSDSNLRSTGSGKQDKAIARPSSPLFFFFLFSFLGACVVRTSSEGNFQDGIALATGSRRVEIYREKLPKRLAKLDRESASRRMVTDSCRWDVISNKPNAHNACSVLRILRNAPNVGIGPPLINY